MRKRTSLESREAIEKALRHSSYMKRDAALSVSSSSEWGRQEKKRGGGDDVIARYPSGRQESIEEKNRRRGQTDSSPREKETLDFRQPQESVRKPPYRHSPPLHRPLPSEETTERKTETRRRGRLKGDTSGDRVDLFQSARVGKCQEESENEDEEDDDERPIPWKNRSRSTRVDKDWQRLGGGYAEWRSDYPEVSNSSSSDRGRWDSRLSSRSTREEEKEPRYTSLDTSRQQRAAYGSLDEEEPNEGRNEIVSSSTMAAVHKLLIFLLFAGAFYLIYTTLVASKDVEEKEEQTKKPLDSVVKKTTTTTTTTTSSSRDKEREGLLMHQVKPTVYSPPTYESTSPPLLHAAGGHMNLGVKLDASPSSLDGAVKANVAVGSTVPSTSLPAPQVSPIGETRTGRESDRTYEYTDKPVVAALKSTAKRSPRSSRTRREKRSVSHSSSVSSIPSRHSENSSEPTHRSTSGSHTTRPSKTPTLAHPPPPYRKRQLPSSTLVSSSPLDDEEEHSITVPHFVSSLFGFQR